ncbi:HdeD family acid-resistance protein [Microbulbifer sediminum]|uniref:HdeD family acid-resistance protein n=1 Tax=Microbulbifer sediminum TaxID=2904250 RepID=UPI001F2DDCDF|nr:HdeD family acid-resistance protein [Microbulbifer sediminum]
MGDATEPGDSRQGRSMTLLGILTVILGILAILAPSVTGFSIALLIGALVLVGGVFRLVWAFRAGSLGKGLIGVALGALTILAGVILLANPIILSGSLTILLAIYFLVDGVVELVAGFSAGGAGNRGWLIIGGAVSILLGILLWSQFPFSGVWALGILFGIKLFFIGMIMITGGRVLRA